MNKIILAILVISNLNSETLENFLLSKNNEIDKYNNRKIADQITKVIYEDFKKDYTKNYANTKLIFEMNKNKNINLISVIIAGADMKSEKDIINIYKKRLEKLKKHFLTPNKKITFIIILRFRNKIFTDLN
ncbi:hypothetical protein AHALO_1683 [Malaciobacter halophilus]|uniref:hypothetical protein n=1 Tax=Malaciobacter halophilus TaxID=197482 RepID=UPI000E0B9F2E|nr:hypothetical protein [Malaciobacter halophilus]AXH10049.1 hypothetical protein AHALO_1683 [Malaciobacter halophilus]